MRLRFSTILGTALICSGGGAFAQGGDLAGITMRVLDDVTDVDAVIVALDANRGAGEESANQAKAAEAAAKRAAEASAEEDPLKGRDRAQLPDPDDDERSEGKLEDRDVEQPTAPAVP
jgi:hypothetical protein